MKKAYDNKEFIHSPKAREVRVLCEFLEPQQRLAENNIDNTIVFFGSARLLSTDDANALLRKLRADPDKAKSKEMRQAEQKLKLASYYDDAMELSRRITEWSSKRKEADKFYVCSGGGPGIMEAVNRGAHEIDGKNVGFRISMPASLEAANPYITPELDFEFHYFFMRKYWFAYLAKALVIFPGGFGTLDELMEILTLIQTQKIKKKMPIVIYGTDYWHSIINFKSLAEWGTISEDDLKLFHFSDTVDDAYEYLVAGLKDFRSKP